MNCSRRLFLFLWLGQLVTCVAAGGAVTPRPVLDQEQAFRLTAARADNGDMELTFVVAPGHYLYRDRFKLSSQGREIPGSVLKWPPGRRLEDPTFGRVLVYRESVRLLVPSRFLATDAKKGGAAELLVTSQGCADAGICYPPVRQVVSLRPGERVANLSVVEEGFAHSSSGGTPLSRTLIKPR